MKHLFPATIIKKWSLDKVEWNCLQEIRLRVHKPIHLHYQSMDFDYGLQKVQVEDLRDIFLHICGNSVYAYEKERENGFFTVEGGHRVGFAGAVTAYHEGRYIVSHITSMNIRIAHEMIDVSREVIPYCMQDNIPLNTLIISPPGLGKTTLLRDMTRVFGEKWKVGVVDERGEIAGAYQGVPVLDCGKYTDVLTGIEKKKGIDILLRTMSPQLIVIDEIGVEEDAKGIEKASVCGCAILASAHGKSLEDLGRREELREILVQKHFDRYLVIKQIEQGSRVVDVFDQDGVKVCIGKPLRVA